MSHFAEVQTVIKNESALVAAIEELEPSWAGNVVVDREGSRLADYWGNPSERIANVIVRRKFIHNNTGSRGDIGFALGENGKYRIVLDDYDQKTYGSEWVGRLTQIYAKNVVKQEAHRLGQRIASEETREDGSIRLILEI